MPGLGTKWATNRRAGIKALPIATLVCLILLALLAVIQVTHLHTSDRDADHCPLCIVMHSAAPVTVAAIVVVIVQLGVLTAPVEARVAVRYWNPKLFTRPPPNGLQG